MKTKLGWNILRLEGLIGDKVEASKLRVTLHKAQRRLQLPEEFSREDAVSILDLLCGEEGVLGVAARFAKVRVVLMSDD